MLLIFCFMAHYFGLKPEWGSRSQSLDNYLKFSTLKSAPASAWRWIIAVTLCIATRTCPQLLSMRNIVLLKTLNSTPAIDSMSVHIINNFGSSPLVLKMTFLPSLDELLLSTPFNRYHVGCFSICSDVSSYFCWSFSICRVINTLESFPILPLPIKWKAFRTLALILSRRMW